MHFFFRFITSFLSQKTQQWDRKQKKAIAWEGKQTIIGQHNYQNIITFERFPNILLHIIHIWLYIIEHFHFILID